MARERTEEARPVEQLLGVCQRVQLRRGSCIMEPLDPTGNYSLRSGYNTAKRAWKMPGVAHAGEEGFWPENGILTTCNADEAQGGQILVLSLLKELVASAGDIRLGEDRGV